MDHDFDAKDGPETETQHHSTWQFWRAGYKYTAIHGNSSEPGRIGARHAKSTVVVALVFLVLLSSALSIWGTTLWHRKRYGELYGHGLQADVNGFVPVFPQKPVYFMNDTGWKFVEHPTEKESIALAQNWASLFPNGHGFVEVHNETAGIDLPPPLVYQGRHIYVVSMFHQLHCLQELGQNIHKLVHDQRLSSRELWHS